MTQRADRAAVEHGLGALPGHDLWKLKSIAVGFGLRAACCSMARAPARSPAIGFSANTGLPSASARSAIFSLQAGQRRDGDRLDIAVLDQCAPIAIGLRDAADSRAISAVRAALLPASATTSQRGSARNAGNRTVRP